MSLKMEGGLQVHIQRPIHELFDELICASGSIGQPLRQCPGRLIKLCQGNAAIDQSNALSLCATDVLCKQRNFQGPTQANLSRVGFLERCPKKPPGKPQDTMYLLMLLQQLGRPVHPKNLPLKAQANQARQVVTAATIGNQANECEAFA